MLHPDATRISGLLPNDIGTGSGRSVIDQQPNSVNTTFGQAAGLHQRER